MIQVDELVRFRDMADNVKLVNCFQFRGREGYGGGRVTFTFERIFRPLPCRSQVFERVVIFDKNVQEGHLNRLRRATKTNRTKCHHFQTAYLAVRFPGFRSDSSLEFARLG